MSTIIIHEHLEWSSCADTDPIKLIIFHKFSPVKVTQTVSFFESYLI